MFEITSFDRLVSIGVEGTFYLATLIFIIFSLSIAYHWFSYGTNKATSMMILVIYLGVSSVLFISMALSLNAIL